MNEHEAVIRVAAFRVDERIGVGVVRGEALWRLQSYSDACRDDGAVHHFFQDWEAGEVDWALADCLGPVSEVTLMAPFRTSAKILCQVVNYAEHGEEASIDPPSRPFFFQRPATSVIGPQGGIQAHGQSKAVDFEVELAVVIGRSGRNIDRADAVNHVGALMVANDVSYRDLQFNRGHEDLNHRFGRNWTHGKGLDGSCALGPWLTLTDSANEVVRPRRIECFVNGERRQNATTDQMLFDIAELVSAASQGMTLACGDVILTGTPAGVGLGDSRFLGPGDVVRSTIEGLGCLQNPVVAV